MTPVERVLAKYSTGSELVRRAEILDDLLDLKNELEEEALLAVILEDRETR